MRARRLSLVGAGGLAGQSIAQLEDTADCFAEQSSTLAEVEAPTAPAAGFGVGAALNSRYYKPKPANFAPVYLSEEANLSRINSRRYTARYYLPSRTSSWLTSTPSQAKAPHLLV